MSYLPKTKDISKSHGPIHNILSLHSVSLQEEIEKTPSIPIKSQEEDGAISGSSCLLMNPFSKAPVSFDQKPKEQANKRIPKPSCTQSASECLGPSVNQGYSSPIEILKSKGKLPFIQSGASLSESKSHSCLESTSPNPNTILDLSKNNHSASHSFSSFSKEALPYDFPNPNQTPASIPQMGTPIPNFGSRSFRNPNYSSNVFGRQMDQKASPKKGPQVPRNALESLKSIEETYESKCRILEEQIRQIQKENSEMAEESSILKGKLQKEKQKRKRLREKLEQIGKTQRNSEKTGKVEKEKMKEELEKKMNETSEENKSLLEKIEKIEKEQKEKYEEIYKEKNELMKNFMALMMAHSEMVKSDRAKHEETLRSGTGFPNNETSRSMLLSKKPKEEWSTKSRDNLEKQLEESKEETETFKQQCRKITEEFSEVVDQMKEEMEQYKQAYFYLKYRSNRETNFPSKRQEFFEEERIWEHCEGSDEECFRELDGGNKEKSWDRGETSQGNWNQEKVKTIEAENDGEIQRISGENGLKLKNGKKMSVKSNGHLSSREGEKTRIVKNNPKSQKHIHKEKRETLSGKEVPLIDSWSQEREEKIGRDVAMIKAALFLHPKWP